MLNLLVSAKLTEIKKHPETLQNNFQDPNETSMDTLKKFQQKQTICLVM